MTVHHTTLLSEVLSAKRTDFRFDFLLNACAGRGCWGHPSAGTPHKEGQQAQQGWSSRLQRHTLRQDAVEGPAHWLQPHHGLVRRSNASEGGSRSTPASLLKIREAKSTHALARPVQ